MILMRVLTLLIAFVAMTHCNSSNSNSNQKGQDETKMQDKVGDTTQSTANAGNTEPSIREDTGQTSMNNLSKSSSQADEDEKNYDSIQIEIDGYIKDGENLEVILDRLIIGSREPLASTVVGNTDEFGFVGKVAGPGLFQIRFPSGVIPIVLTKGTLNFRTDINNLNNYEVSGDGGAEETRDFNRFREIRREIGKMDDSLQKVLENTEGKQRIEIHKKLNKINRKQDAKRHKAQKAFVQEMWEKESIVAIIAALRMDIDKSPEFIKNLAMDYKEIYPNNYFVENLVDKTKRYEKLIENRKKQQQESESQ